MASPDCPAYCIRYVIQCSSILLCCAAMSYMGCPDPTSAAQRACCSTKCIDLSILHITQDARLDILQFRVQLVPHPPLRLGPLRTEHEITDAGNLAITQVFSMAVLAPADRIDQCPGTLLGRAAHHPELEFEGGGGIAEELGGAEARVEQVEDDEGFSGGGGGDGGGEGAAVEDLEEFAVEVAGGHLGHGAGSVV